MTIQIFHYGCGTSGELPAELWQTILHMTAGPLRGTPHNSRHATSRVKKPTKLSVLPDSVEGGRYRNFLASWPAESCRQGLEEDQNRASHEVTSGETAKAPSANEKHFPVRVAKEASPGSSVSGRHCHAVQESTAEKW